MSGADIFLSFAFLKPLKLNAFHYSQSRGVHLSTTKSKWEVGRGYKPKDVWIHHARTSASVAHATITRDPQGSLTIKDHLQNGTWIVKDSCSRSLAIKVTSPEILYDSSEVWLGPPDEALSSGFIFIDVLAHSPFLRKYAYHSQLGSGAFGDVCKFFARADPSQFFAVKVLDYGSEGASSRFDCLKEVELLKLARSHPRICSLLESFHDEVNNKFYLVLEYMPCGSLASYYANRKPASAAETRVIMKQVSEGIAYLHELGIVHRDCKPDNILIKRLFPYPEFALSDLGLAQRSRSSRLHTRAGTPFYMAPEIFQKNGDFSTGYTNKVDCWGVALTGFNILIGIHESPWVPGPHSRTSPELDWDAMRRRKVGVNGQDFFKNMLCINPDRRWSMKMALDCAWLRTVPPHPDAGKLRVQATTPLSMFPAPQAIQVRTPVGRGKLRSTEDVLRALKLLNNLPPLVGTPEAAPGLPGAVALRRSPRVVKNANIKRPATLIEQADERVQQAATNGHEDSSQEYLPGNDSGSSAEVKAVKHKRQKGRGNGGVRAAKGKERVQGVQEAKADKL
ncbi:unnamed protein product [Peniophora sp. CBMAI 1063]|nr:unnamed protein product [Peniophora sp. CBMAI 1063]